MALYVAKCDSMAVESTARCICAGPALERQGHDREISPLFHTKFIVKNVKWELFCDPVLDRDFSLDNPLLHSTPTIGRKGKIN